MLISMHGPIRRTAAKVKEKFYDALQAVISLVPSSVVVLVVGDFNTRVGCANKSFLWDAVLGIFGVGKGH